MDPFTPLRTLPADDQQQIEKEESGPQRSRFFFAYVVSPLTVFTNEKPPVERQEASVVMRGLRLPA